MSAMRRKARIDREEPGWGPSRSSPSIFDAVEPVLVGAKLFTRSDPCEAFVRGASITARRAGGGVAPTITILARRSIIGRAAPHVLAAAGELLFALLVDVDRVRQLGR